MKAISLWQPWASLVAFGEKRFETRSWSTAYRGPIAIHATKTFPASAVYLCANEPPFHATLAKAGFRRPDELPRGAVVAVAELVACISTNDLRDLLAEWPKGASRDEEDFGDFSPGRWAWKMENVRRLADPVPAKGARGLWEWTPAARDLVYVRIHHVPAKAE